MASEDMPSVVIDNGSSTMKVGFCGDDAPIHVFPSIISRARHGGITVGIDYSQCFVGDDAISRRGYMDLKYPIRSGIIVNWDDMEKIWHHIFYRELRVDPEDETIVLTEPPLNPKAHRERMTQIMFETFRVSSLYIRFSAFFSLLSYKKTTGIVLDSGEDVSHVVPIYEWFYVPHAITRLDFAGKKLTEFLCRLLNEKGYSFSTPESTEVVKDIKEKLCYVVQNYDDEINSMAHRRFEDSYETDDGSEVVMGYERFKCPEALFKPAMMGMEGFGVAESVFQSIMKCSIDIRSEMFENIVLAGGCTMFHGFKERLHTELASLASNEEKINILANPDRTYSAWLGGSIFGCYSVSNELFIDRQEYDLVGPIVAHNFNKKQLTLLV